MIIRIENRRGFNKIGLEIMRALDDYIIDPGWSSQSIAHIPILMSKVDKSSPFIAKGELDADILNHICIVLAFWNAFKGTEKRGAIWGNTKSHLDELAKRVKQSTQFTGRSITSLSDFSSAQINEYIDRLVKHLTWFEAKTKGTKSKSLVYPSKVAHLLFPSLIPTYDRTAIANEAMRPIIARTNGSFQDYLELSWLVLAELKSEGLLGNAREKVADYLTNEWVAQHLAVNASRITAMCLCKRLDALVAEYAVIGMARYWNGKVRKPFEKSGN